MHKVFLEFSIPKKQLTRALLRIALFAPLKVSRVK